MLHVPETRVRKPRFPPIDVHTHLTCTRRNEMGVASGEQVDLSITPAKALEVMDRMGVRAVVNLTGGTGQGLAGTISTLDRAYPGRFYSCTEPSYGQFREARYPQIQADAIEAAARAGARGLKILKTLGLFLRERITEGPLVKVDDSRFDPMWEACAAHDLPVFIHVSDPEALLSPGRLPQRTLGRAGAPPRLVLSRTGLPEPRGADGGPRPHARPASEDAFRRPARGTRRGEPGLRGRFARPLPEHERRASERASASWAGSLGSPEGSSSAIRTASCSAPTPYPARGRQVPQQVFKDELYEIYYRFLDDRDDDYFDYAPAPVPPQGRWAIYGVGLPEAILKKVYLDNAARVLRIAS